MSDDDITANTPKAPRRRRAPLQAAEAPTTDATSVIDLRADDIGDHGHGDELLRVTDVDASYGPIQVLFGASIVVHRGERVALLGTNGAGKSTLLRVASGLLPVTRGKVWFKGEDVTGTSPHRLVSKGMTYIAGGRATFPSLTVLENLRLSGYPVRRDKAEVQRRVDEAMDTFPRLRERSSQKCGTLSGGEQQMVALGRALVATPELLIIDELSLGLAPVILREIQSMIATLAGRGITMLIVEQSLNMAAAIAERSYFMEKGEIRFEGLITDLMERGDLARAVFFGGHDEDEAPKSNGRRRATAKR
jgi:ABC-type branched-subunit amino acid transport system ATPase component